MEEKQRHAVFAQRAHVIGRLQFLGVIAGNDEERIGIPRLLPRGHEELFDSEIHVPDGFVDSERALLEASTIFTWNWVGVVRGQCKDGGREGRLLAGQFFGHVLQIRFVRDSPRTVEISSARILLEAEIMRDARAAHESVKAQRAILRAMKKAAGVAAWGEEEAQPQQ